MRRGRRSAWGLLGLGAFAAQLALTGAAGAKPATPVVPVVAGAATVSQAHVTSFRLPHAPSEARALIAAPDGDVWFGAANGKPGEPRRYVLAIERIDRLGQVSMFADHLGADGFATTADGSIWFTDARKIGRIAPDGALSTFPLPGGEPSPEISFAAGPIVAGADGNLWFSGSRSSTAGSEPKIEPVATIDRITPGGDVSEFALPGVGGYPTELTAGPDGDVWFTALGDNRVGRIAPDGSIAEFALPPFTRPDAIAAGPDGSLWFTEEPESGPAIGRITTAGAFTQFHLPVEQGSGGTIVAGPDGRLWFGGEAGTIWRISPEGRFSRVELPDKTGVNAIVVGREGDLWYTAAPEPPCLATDGSCSQLLPTAPGIVGRVEPAPISAAILGARLVARGRRVVVGLACGDGSAGGTCRGKLELRAGKATIGQRKFALGVDRSRSFGLRLSGLARARLARSGRLRALCTTTVAGGRTETRPLRFRRRPAAAPR